MMMRMFISVCEHVLDIFLVALRDAELHGAPKLAYV